jgi:hypothetical protein
MSLAIATFIPGLLLLAVGAPLFLCRSGAIAALKAFPRSQAAAVVCFGGGAAWFLYNIAHLSEADFGNYRGWLFLAFALIAALSFKCVPDFLAVRGACVLMLLGAMPLLDAAYVEYSHPQRLFMVTAVYVGIALALWLGAQPWRLRDFFEWLFARTGRARALGGLLTAYGLALCVVALTY